jgi:serine/threonine protein phosphatase 1
MQNQIYIISDIHGCFKSLKALINQFPNKENSKIVFVGDLIDRGASSCEVVKFVMQNNYDCIMGNHEEMFLEFAPSKENEDLSNSKHWLFKCGGEETLKSYTCKDEYYKQYDFIKTLPLYLEYKDYKTTDNRYLVVSHSAVGKVWDKRDSKDKDDIKEFESHLLYSRYKNSNNKEIFNVFGHTIFSAPVVNEYSAAIDLGCYHEKDESKLPNPRLCALEFPSMKIYTQENIEGV